MIRFIFFIIIFFNFSICLASEKIVSNIDTSLFGFTVLDKPISIEHANEILDTLLPINILKEHGFNISETQKTKSYLLDHGDNDKILNIDRRFSHVDKKMSIHIERPVSTVLRHKIMIGTDKKEWNILKKETSYPKNNPFYRVYLLQFGNTDLFQGLIFMDGVWVEFQWVGIKNNKVVQKLKKITWLIAKNLKQNYETMIFPLAKKLDHNGPVLTRPDLPDPDRI